MGRSGHFADGAGDHLYHASMGTEHYHFDAFGRSQEEAQAALRQGFHNHLKQSGGSMKEFRDNSDGISDPLEYYDAHTVRVPMGGAIRDRDRVVYDPNVKKRGVPPLEKS